MSSRLFQVTTLAVLSAATTLSATAGHVAFAESVSGDLSTVSSAPTDVSFAVGSNEISGSSGRSVTGGPVDRDFFRFTIPAKHELSAIEVLSGTTAIGAGSLAFLGIVAASDFGATPPTTAGTLLGYHHYSPSEIGTDILDDVGAGAGATGFTGPLGPGTYSVWIQETAVGSASYNFDFKVSHVPDSGPGTLVGMGTLGLTLLAGRRFRKA